MSLPENFTESMKAANFLKLNVFQMISFGCISSGFDYYGQLMTMTLLPIGIGIVSLLASKTFAAKRKGLIATILLIVIYSVMPSVSTTVFGSFPCDELDTGERYLISDYSINCSSRAYSRCVISYA